MTVSEYEERFRISSPSLHETFVAMQGSGPRRRRRQRFWAAIALAGGIMATNEVAPRIPLTILRTVLRKWRTPMSDQPLYRPQDDRPVTQASVDAENKRTPAHLSANHLVPIDCVSPLATIIGLLRKCARKPLARFGAAVWHRDIGDAQSSWL
jgi:hypothetical protein